MTRLRFFVTMGLATALVVGAAACLNENPSGDHPAENDAVGRAASGEIVRHEKASPGSPATTGTLTLVEKGAEKSGDSPAVRPAKWAKPIEKDGLPNLAKVSETLYRGAQPTAEGMAELEKMGVKSVVNLRSFHSDRKLLKETKLDYTHITMKAWHPEYKELVQFLKIASDKEKQPVFVHCQHGSDRTGLNCAVYRIAVQNWSLEEAMREMRQGGFGFHEVWKNIPPYLESLDFKKLRKDAGIPPVKEADGKKDC